MGENKSSGLIRYHPNIPLILLLVLGVKSTQKPTSPVRYLRSIYTKNDHAARLETQTVTSD